MGFLQFEKEYCFRVSHGAHKIVPKEKKGYFEVLYFFDKVFENIIDNINTKS